MKSLTVIVCGIILLASLAKCAEFKKNVHDMILEVNEREVKKRKVGDDDNVDDEINKINEENHVPNLVEGDVVITKQESLNKRGATSDRTRRWPNNIVPYVFSPSFPAAYKKNVLKVIADFHTKTCIGFRPKKSGDKNWILIVKETGCWSMIGKNGGAQKLSIGSDGCNNPGLIQHELMHALGFGHEQNRSDRDKFVEIKWQNVRPDNSFINYKQQFQKAAAHHTIENKIYDFDSVMHYGRTAFAKGSQPTIVAKNDPTRTLGNWIGATDLDIAEINNVYKCRFPEGTVKGVFLVFKGRYTFNYAEAGDACKSVGAQLVSLHQLYVAYAAGMNKCSCGWTTDEKAHYPISKQESLNSNCGGSNPGVRTCGGRSTWNAYCYKRPVQLTYSVNPCTFPFIFNGKEYSDCVPYQGKRWCAVTVDSEKVLTGWSYCI